jgi:hypothetical protein
LDRATAELTEARRLRGEGFFSSIAKIKAGGLWGSLSPKTRALLEGTFSPACARPERWKNDPVSWPRHPMWAERLLWVSGGGPALAQERQLHPSKPAIRGLNRSSLQCQF